jgi:hypothetical protein
MVSQLRNGLAALVLALGTAGLLYACSSSDDSNVGGSGAATTSPGGSGGLGGSAGHGAQAGGVGATGAGGALGGHGGTAGSGGGLSPTETCLQVCDAMEYCINGSGGAGGAGGAWVQGCLGPCYPSLASCTVAQLEALLACLSPNIQPNCDFAAYNVCANAVGCVDSG